MAVKKEKPLQWSKRTILDPEAAGFASKTLLNLETVT